MTTASPPMPTSYSRPDLPRVRAEAAELVRSSRYSEAADVLVAALDPAVSTLGPTHADVVSLLDRGFVYAIAHVRGGQEMGRAWYEAGKLAAKRNTFTDFIDAADALATAGLVDPDRIYAEGGSAGGLLVGAALNLRPDRWDGVVAHVPFVDVVTTMLDDTIPLTTGEYDEWGNPAGEAAFRTMLAYSPYDNVRAQAYPHMLITAGLNDPRVAYWEPAKFTARLRALKTDGNRLVLRTNMGAGHGGASGRWDFLKEVAFKYAFLLDVLGIAG